MLIEFHDVRQVVHHESFETEAILDSKFPIEDDNNPFENSGIDDDNAFENSSSAFEKSSYAFEKSSTFRQRLEGQLKLLFKPKIF